MICGLLLFSAVVLSIKGLTDGEENMITIQRSTVLAILVVVALAAAVGFGVNALTSNPAAAESNTNYMNFSTQNVGIWVNGQGKVTVIPDIAVISMGVEAQATTIEEAQNQAAESMDALMRVLKDAGVADKDITTQYFNVNAIYNWDEITRASVITGYRVANTVSVKIRNIQDAGGVIDDVVAAAGKNARINSIYFTVENPEQYYDLARENAMNDAKHKAEQMASLGGAQLGKPTYIYEGNSYYPPVIRYDKAYAESDTGTPATQISPGETDIIINVQVVYSIQ
jgi:uncharacterized protein YggE